MKGPAVEVYDRYREAFQKGQNVMRLARRWGRGSKNSSEAILLAYDLQAGSYLRAYRKNPGKYEKIYKKIVTFILQGLGSQSSRPFSLLEVGVGDGTTLRGVLALLGKKVGKCLGFDLSWSRISVARNWLGARHAGVELFVGTLFRMPLPDNSIDVVYTHHSLEPNGGREKEALQECLRVARRCVVLIEPCYEKAGPAGQRRMKYHGYVKNLAGVARKLGANIMLHQLVAEPLNPMNPSGVLILKKNGQRSTLRAKGNYVCPVTRTPVQKKHGCYCSRKAKLVYPILLGIPLLRPENAIIANKL
jgi:SAM-dependent methyltransferase